MLRTLLETALVPLSAAAAAGCAGAPPEEVDALVVAVTAATFLAAQGRAADGYTCLLAARRRVEGLERADTAALSDRYRQVMRHYADRYGVAVE